MSGYEIKKLIGMSIQHFWDESYGQIYPTLNQLVSDGFAVRKESEGNRTRHLYSITPRGRRALLEWLAEPTAEPTVRSEMQLKFFLTARVSDDEGIRLVEEYRTGQQRQHAEFVASEAALRTAIRNHAVPEEISGVVGTDPDQLLVFLLSLRHGVLATEARLAWCDEAVKALRARKRRRTSTPGNQN